jgi:phosphoribosylglycinamide formyltransferase-1
VRLGLITYDAPHLKTAQVALNLAERGGVDLHFFALPFHQRKARQVLFSHRPDQATGPESRAVAAFLGASFTAVTSADDIREQGFDYFLIVGAPLLPAGFVERTLGRVVNAHPGIIPFARGLDAFKWSIVEGIPLGNSLHFIDAEADAGEVIAIRPTPLFATDTLQSVAARHYQLEIDMLSYFDRYLSDDRPPIDMSLARPARMRMPRDVEERLEQAFVGYRDSRAVT